MMHWQTGMRKLKESKNQDMLGIETLASQFQRILPLSHTITASFHDNVNSMKVNQWAMLLPLPHFTLSFQDCLLQYEDQWATLLPHYITPTSFHNCLLLYGDQCNEGEPVSHTTPPLHLQAFITVSYYMEINAMKVNQWATLLPHYTYKLS